MDAPTNAGELYRQMPDVVARLTGGTNWVSGVEDSAVLATHLPWVRAWFSPTSRSVSVNPSLTKRIAAFYHTSSAPRRSLSASESAERWELGLLKTDLVVLTATILRGVGPSDERVMEGEWDSLWQFPHGHTVANGVPESLAARMVDAVARELGIVDRDPRFAEVDSLQSRYVAQVGLVDAVAGDVATGRGTLVTTELLAMARAGSGHLALWTLARRAAGSPELGDVAVLDRPGGWVELRQAFDGGMAGTAGDWTVTQDPAAGFDQDLAAAEYWGGVVHRNIRTAARRVMAGPGGAIDVSKLGVAISAAAEEASREVDTSMDFLQAAWMDAEVGVDA